MFATKLTLIMLGLVLYVSASICWFFWIGPGLLMDGETADLIGAFAGTCTWLLITFSLVIQIIKTARPAAAGRR
ncbi:MULTISPECIES: hypothetical protein [Pseudomonas]|uniref:Uncharacterized protein n=1 Tax=Pseudomonas salomonii TaxID=191391 RepID=A0ABS9GTJ4_9PSED|nr:MULTISPECIES: hypothetical protein [Pseudomonas]KQM46407.1 hypothetical protein ASE80_16755 [Pseudomonas sp. Leaf15]MCF5547757.1 hypothetical protein [Pseudomonas salomonii]RAH01661.1 hypothetical protein DJ480_16820 [Pseudomonas sp. Leaf98]